MSGTKDIMYVAKIYKSYKSAGDQLDSIVGDLEDREHVLSVFSRSF